MNLANLLRWKLIQNVPAAVALLSFMAAAGALAGPPDFIIETPGGQFNYRVNGVDGNPTITLMRGHTYTFLVTNTAAFHPCAFGNAIFGDPLPGVTGDNTSDGTITYAVPNDATDGAYYCSLHGFGGEIKTVGAPPPPEITIVDLKVGTNLTLTSTLATTNGLMLIPEFNTNSITTNWYALTVQTNRFLNGTNEAICGKPNGNAVLIRIRAQQN